MNYFFVFENVVYSERTKFEMESMKSVFHTDYKYKDRETKAKYVYVKYSSILRGKILDVGADQCSLKQHLPNDVEYLGIGLQGGPDLIKIDLEKEAIPFDNNAFDCVLCLDVLEHLENVHEVFDELCRVSKKYVIISLPNPHGAFWNYLTHGNYYEYQNMKFYGIPLEKPPDRHKWFFSTEEAERFVQYRAKKNNMEIIQMDVEGSGVPKIAVIKRLISKLYLRRYFNVIFNRNLYTGAVWAVLKKRSGK